MKVVHNILVALDFGPQTEAVIASAARLAKKFGSELYLLHVLPGSEDASALDTNFVEMAREGAEVRLSEIGDRLDEDGVSIADVRITLGSPFDQIIRVADDLDANVTVVGSHSDTGADARRLGITTERLCRKSSKPVWIVASEADGDLRSLLCPVDCSGASRRALTNAIHLARSFEAELHMLHVVPPPPSLSSLFVPNERVDEQERLETAMAKLENFLEDFDFHNVQWRKTVRQGLPADTIIETAGTISADLIVMGSVGRTGLSRILMGSVADKVVRNLPCSMVMVKAEDAIRLRLDEEISELTTRYERGCELLENGFLEEARRQFEQCTRTTDLYVPAWHGLAEVYQRQGEADRAEDCRETARKLEELLAWQRVEADIRRGHPLWRRDAAE